MMLIMFKSVRECIQKFRKEIRRSSLEKYKQRKRQALLKSLSRQHLINRFQSLQKEKVINSLISIFENCEDILMNPFSSHLAMQDEKQQPISINLHVYLLRTAYEEIKQYDDNGDLQTTIYDYVMTIIGKYTSQQVHKHIQYEQQLYHIIDLLITSFSSEDSKVLMKWAQSIELLWLIQQLVSYADTINCNTHSNLFKMIEQGLSSKNQKYQIDALHLLIKILKFSDQHDIFLIYQQLFIIPQQIINLMEVKISQSSIDLIDYWTPMLYLMNTFDEALIGYTKTGIISLCDALIASNNESNIFGALQMLILFSGIRCLIDLLLLDEQMDDSKMWLVRCLKNNVYIHSNDLIRKSFARLVRGVIRMASHQQLHNICSKFMINQHSLLAWLEWVFGSEDDVEVKTLGLECVERLLINEEDMDANLNQIVNHLHANKIIAHIAALQHHPHPNIRQICGDLLDRVTSIQGTSMSEL